MSYDSDDSIGVEVTPERPHLVIETSPNQHPAVLNSHDHNTLKKDEKNSRDVPVDDPGTKNDEVPNKWSGQSNILVAVRVRPLLKHDKMQKSVVRVLDHKMVVILDPAKAREEAMDVLRQHRSREKKYAFDYVFDENDDTSKVYAHTTKFMIQGVLDGFNATVFAYGQTGAGKTHTMIGNVNSPGIMVQTLRDLFAASHKGNASYKVTVSFLEVYNENIRDLLSELPASVGENLDLREDPIRGPIVAGITEVEVESAAAIMELLEKGNTSRMQAPTAANEVSSRSHAVLQVVVENRELEGGQASKIKIGKLSLIDLAGSERAAATKNRGARLQEGANINKSLLALGNCINALGEKGRGAFVPYRDSKLTRLLKDSLGGNCRTVMIANISAAVSCFDETLNTLKYANRAKNIKTTVVRNVVSVNHHISEYVSLISNLRGEISRLKGHLKTKNGVSDAASPLHSSPSHSPLMDHHHLSGDEARTTSGGGSLDKKKLAEMKNWIQENFRERMQLRRSLIELEDQNVQNSIEIGKRQVGIVKWTESRGRTPKRGQVDFDTDSASTSLVEELLRAAPESVKTAWGECEQLKQSIDKNVAVKRNIAKRLRENERQAEEFQSSGMGNVTGEDRQELLGLQYKIGKLELENMELEQSQFIHKSIMKGKDLTIQKLQLQLAMKDRLIEQQRAVLAEHSLGDKVSGYASNLLIDHKQLAQPRASSSHALSPTPEGSMFPFPDEKKQSFQEPVRGQQFPQKKSLRNEISKIPSNVVRRGSLYVSFQDGLGHPIENRVPVLREKRNMIPFDSKNRRQISNAHTNGSVALIKQNADGETRLEERRRRRTQVRQGKKYGRQRWRNDESKVAPAPISNAIFAEGTNPLYAVHPVNSDDDGSVGSHQQRQRRQQEKHPKERDIIVPHPPNPRPVMRNGGAYAADPRPKGFAAHKAIDRNDKESKGPSPENLPQLGRGATSDDILEESFDDLDNVDLPPRAEKDTIDPPHRRVHNVPKSKIVSSVNPSLVINGGNGVSLADRAAERAAERAVERAERLGTLRGKLSNRQSMSNAGNIGSQPPHSVTGEGEGTVDNTGFGSTILATTLSFPTVDGATDD